MKMTREDKKELVGRLADKGGETATVGVLDVHGLPSKQLQQIKKELGDAAVIRMTRRTLIERVLEKMGGGAEELAEIDSIQPALIFSDESPFLLFKTIKSKKSSAPAKAGAIAPNDIVLEAGPTPLPPGPAIGELQALGAKTKVEDGKIAIVKRCVAIEEGEEITKDEADILNKLGMEPLQVGLDLKAAFEAGTVYPKSVLDIDEELYHNNLMAAAQQAFNVAMFTGLPTAQTIRPLLQKATRQGRNLALEAGIVTPETVKELIAKGSAERRALESQINA